MKYRPLFPDTLLFIYCIQGEVPEQKCQSLDCFLGNWQDGGYSFLFFQEPVDDLVQCLVADNKYLQLIDQYAMTYEQWQGGTGEPFRLGGFIIYPPGDKSIAAPGQLSFTLDAGLVFGNGTHPTTRDCLQAIEYACCTGHIQSMLDLGTGSGVLALGAARLGVEKIAAVDYTLLAAHTAQRNVKLNELENQIVVVNGRAEDFSSIPADLLVANVHYEVMQSIVEEQGLSKQGLFILSGLLSGEAEKIVKALHSMEMNILKRWEAEQTWHTLLGSNCKE